MSKSVTLSVIKADIGGWVGHSAIHPALAESAKESLAAAKRDGLLIDYHVTACGDLAAIRLSTSFRAPMERLRQPPQRNACRSLPANMWAKMTRS